MSTDTTQGQDQTDDVDQTDTLSEDSDTAEAIEDTGADSTDAGSGDEDQDDASDSSSGREAAKYRRRLRDAEAERDTLATRVEALQCAEVERQASAGGLKPAALWASGIELGELVGDDGTVDGEKLSHAIAAAREQLGIPKPPGGNYVKNEGRSPGRPAKPSGKAAMANVVMGRSVAGDD